MTEKKVFTIEQAKKIGEQLMTGKIALAHLNEYPDYYDRHEKMEKEAEEYWAKRKK